MILRMSRKVLGAVAVLALGVRVLLGLLNRDWLWGFVVLGPPRRGCRLSGPRWSPWQVPA